MTSENPLALLLGSGGVEILRSLAMVGVSAGVVAPARDPAHCSRHAQSVLTWDWSPDRNDAALASRLVAFGRQQAEPPVLIYGTEQSMLFVSRQRDLLANGFRFVVPDPALVEAVHDKVQFARLADAVPLPVPRTLVLDPDQPDPPEECAQLNFPLIVKPTTRDESWESGLGVESKALRVESMQQMGELWPRLQKLSKPPLAQEYIVGPESAIVSYHVYMDDRGGIAGEFTGRKIRTVPAEYGFTSSLSITDDAAVTEAGREVCRKLDLRGVAKLDFKYGPDGRLHLLEINARFSLWAHAGARAGVNLPALVYADLTGRPRPAETASRAGTHWVHPKDLHAARSAGMSTAAWLRWVWRQKPVLAMWRWNDPLPFLNLVAGRLGNKLSRAPSSES